MIMIRDSIFFFLSLPYTYVEAPFRPIYRRLQDFMMNDKMKDDTKLRINGGKKRLNLTFKS